MPPTQPTPPARGGRRCSALTTSGEKCQRLAVTGLTVCKSHGGGTAASVRAGKRAIAREQVATLWGISTDASSFSIEEELIKLARAKLTDITALRIELSQSGRKHIGLLTNSKEITESETGEEIYTTVKTKRLSGTSPWVQELHKAEQELVQILRLLQEVTGGTEEMDLKRLRLQTAREAARLIKAFPGISVDEVAAELNKRAS